MAFSRLAAQHPHELDDCMVDKQLTASSDADEAEKARRWREIMARIDAAWANDDDLPNFSELRASQNA